MSNWPISTKIPVLWGDMDSFGHVNNIIYLKWCETYTEGEMFARAVQRWDKDMGETPTFWFTSDEAMQRARESVFEDEA